MDASTRRRKVLEEAWIGDAILSLYARQRILRENAEVDAQRFERMTCNRFLGCVGDPSEVEAQIGRMYQREGMAAAFAWIDETLMPVFDRQEARRLRRLRSGVRLLAPRDPTV